MCIYIQQLTIWRSSRPSGACFLGWQEVFCWDTCFEYKVYSSGGLTWIMWMFWIWFGFFFAAGESICWREDVWHSDRSVDGTCLRRESCGFRTRGQPLHTFHPRPCVHTRHLLVSINFILNYIIAFAIANFRYTCSYVFGFYVSPVNSIRFLSCQYCVDGADSLELLQWFIWVAGVRITWKDQVAVLMHHSFSADSGPYMPPIKSIGVDEFLLSVKLQCDVDIVECHKDSSEWLEWG